MKCRRGLNQGSLFCVFLCVSLGFISNEANIINLFFWPWLTEWKKCWYKGQNVLKESSDLTHLR